MIIVEADHLASDIASYPEKVKHGETVVITIGNQPVAEMRATPSPVVAPRLSGLCAGEFVTPADFDAPLPDSVLAQFERP